LQIKAAGWPPADEIDACNGNLVVAITQIIAGITIPAKNHLYLPKDLFGLNPKQLDIKKREKIWVPYPLLSSANAPEEKKERGPGCGCRGGGGCGEEQEMRQAAWWLRLTFDAVYLCVPYLY
jgi:hypothetical protein